MKFLVTVSGNTFVLTPTQLEVLQDTLSGAMVLSDEHVGNGNGTHGHNKCYIHKLITKGPADGLETRVIGDDYIETLKLIPKL